MDEKRKLEEDDDDDVPLAQMSLVKKRKTATPVKYNDDNNNDEDNDDDDVPLVKLKGKRTAKRKAKPDDDDDDFDEPLAKKKKKATPTKKKAPVKKRTAASVKNEKTPVKKEKAPVKKEKAKKAANTKGMTADQKAKKAEKDKLEEEKKARRFERERIKKEKKDKEEAETHKWWLEKAQEMEEGQRWIEMQHNGPLFAPEYKPFPAGVQFKYDGKRMALSIKAEEVASYFASMINSDYCEKPKFIENFMGDWRKTMAKDERSVIKDFKKCDFSLMSKYFEEQREARKNRTKEEKETEKQANNEIMEKYGYAMLDRRREKVGNFRLEPPSLFRGRGDHPKMGRLKSRIRASDITVNCSQGFIPKPPEGQKWKEVVCNQSATWLSSWKDFQGSNKYIMFDSGSRFKGESDLAKYEKARELKKNIKRVRKIYEKDLKDDTMSQRQLATATYLIDHLALRCGNEKNTEEEADTVGCCSLRAEHARTEKPDTIHLDFLGKDSIQYKRAVTVTKEVFTNIRLFLKNKSPQDDLFDRMNASQLNKYLQTLMPGLTAKCFRTFEACVTMQEELAKTPTEEASVDVKMLSYNRANREVAVLCNHQRAVPKSFENQMKKLDEKLSDVEAKLKEEQKILKKDFAKIDKGNAKENVAKERQKKKVKMLQEKIEKMKVQKTDKDENKTLAKGTSKLNYLDPRISVAWGRKHDVPVEKVYSAATERKKFMWAFGTPADFVF